jgi:hypothetical protein
MNANKASTVMCRLPALLVLTSCFSGAHGDTSRLTTQYRLGNKVIKVVAKTPSSMDSSTYTQCEIAGSVAPEQVAPIVAYIEEQILTRKVPLAWVLIVDGTSEAAFDPVSASNVAAVAMDVRRGRGELALKTANRETDYYCTSVTEDRQ